MKYGRPFVWLAILLAVAEGSPAAHDATCSTDWLVTGYFTVRESDFDGARIQVTFEDGKTRSYRAAFLDAVKVEGWGRSEQGAYVGYDDGAWRNGWVYDPRNNKHYKGAVRADGETIAIRAFIGTEILGETETLSRVHTLPATPVCKTRKDGVSHE